MRGYLAFVKKEFIEYIRTFKALILIIVFLILGFLNPITAKYLPLLLEEFMPEGMTITIAEPTVMDSWMQFFKNLPQMGILVILIVFSGIMANELSRGTLTNMLTKGLKRSAVVLAKLTAAIVMWTVCYYLAFAVTLLYNQLFWTDTSVAYLFLSVNCVWVFGCFLISILLFGGILFKSTFGSLLLTGGVIAGLFLVQLFPKLSRYNPIQLVSVNMELLEKNIKLSEVYPAIGVTVAFSVLIVFLGVAIFNKKNVL